MGDFNAGHFILLVGTSLIVGILSYGCGLSESKKVSIKDAEEICLVYDRVMLCEKVQK